jgi:hypothetical protein
MHRTEDIVKVTLKVKCDCELDTAGSLQGSVADESFLNKLKDYSLLKKNLAQCS